MADDLSDLDIAAPTATSAVSLGDDAIRDTRRQVRNWADIEHYRTGEHKIPNGAAEPAAGFAGKLFLNTTNNRLSRDDGTIWRLMNVVPFGFLFSASNVGLALSPTFSLLQTITVVVPAGAARLLIYGGFNSFETGATTGQVAQYKFQFDGGDVTQPPIFKTARYTGSTEETYRSLIGVVDSPAAGTKSVTMHGRAMNAILSSTASDRLLLAIVI